MSTSELVGSLLDSGRVPDPGLDDQDVSDYRPTDRQEIVYREYEHKRGN